jgi:signal transduction histidine kinase
MTPLPVPQRWLIALLGAAFLLDVLVWLSQGLTEFPFALPGAAALLACVYLAVSRPGLAAALGTATLVGSSFLIQAVGRVPLWVGIENLTLSEVLAGGALVVLVVWRAQPQVAVLGTAGLVFACLFAIVVRDGRLFALRPNRLFITYRVAELDVRSLAFGFVLLVVCVSTGIYLRQSGLQRIDSDLRTLVRRQWPLGAALTVLLLLDVGSSDGGFGPFGLTETTTTAQLFALAGGAVAAVCAFLAPRAPVRYAIVGAAAIGLATLPRLVIASGEPQFTLSQFAASMALIAFVTRQSRPEPAAWSTAALVTANGLYLAGGRGFNTDYVLPLLFLLLVAVATGLYFRARDRERNQSVKVAVTGAQQAERMALARELHDVVAHHVTGIVVQAQAARLVADDNPGVATRALEKIENSGAEALTAMRMLVGSLRSAQPAGDSTAAAQATSDLEADLRALVDQFTGPTVHLELGLPEQLPHEMGRTVLRLVQESLTNVSKHAADATRVDVGVTTGSGDEGREELHLFVKDDGTARRANPAGGSGGYGLIGMRERVELLGGFFSAGPGSEGGWVVKVAIPLGSRN